MRASLHRFAQGFGAAAIAAAAASAHGAPPDFTGVWSGSITTQDHPYWQIEDHLCFAGCPKIFRERLAGLLDDPANEAQPTDALTRLAFEAMTQDRLGRSTPEGRARIEATRTIDLKTYCEPYGLVREAMNPLPMIVRATADGLAIEYEEWSLARRIHLDGRPHPADLAPTPLGHSVGRYEGDSLVIETAGISGDYLMGLVSPTIRWGSYSDAASVVERYTIKEDPRRLELELTLTDPVTLTEPYVWTKTWLDTPEVELVTDSCEDVPGEF